MSELGKTIRKAISFKLDVTREEFISVFSEFIDVPLNATAQQSRRNSLRSAGLKKALAMGPSLAPYF